MKNILKAAAFCIILTIFINHIYDIFSWKDTAGDYYSSLDSLYELDDDVVDVLFLGSSRCYCTINNSILWKNQGIASFSMSISGQDIASSYHCLVEALKTQTPKVVCLELFGTLFHGYQVESNMYRNTLGYNLSRNAVEAVKNIAPDRAAELLLRWPIIHTRYKELKKQDFAAEKPIYIGYQSGFENKPIGTLCTYFGDEKLAIAEEEEYWLQKIIELVKEKDMELFLFAAPFSSDTTAQKKLNYVKAIAKENGLEFLNMSQMEEELGLNINTDFSDWMHTNYYGAQKASNYISEYLKQTYELPDRRNEEGYELWDEDLKHRTHEFTEEQLKNIHDTAEYLDLLSKAEDYTVIIGSNGNYKSENADFSYYAELFGLEGYNEGSGAWIIENGQIVFKTTGMDMLEYRDLYESSLAISNNQGRTSIVIDKQSFIMVENGINIVVYDNLLQRIVSAVGFDATANYEMKRYY